MVKTKRRATGATLRGRVNKRKPAARATTISNLPMHLVAAHIASKLGFRDRAVLGVAMPTPALRRNIAKQQADEAEEVRALMFVAAQLIKGLGQREWIRNMPEIKQRAKLLAAPLGLEVGESRGTGLILRGEVYKAVPWVSTGEVEIIHIKTGMPLLHSERRSGRLRAVYPSPASPRPLVNAAVRGFADAYGIRPTSVRVLG